ncbi:hypothetical protein [Macrococcus animalis]|uniref:hypothetical protein n=1 Tax=Macrococcus animalis TaxID=3395467 RepID=UPI0039BFFA89
MGFYIMIISFFLGLYLIIQGVKQTKKNKNYSFILIPGIVLLVFSVYLAWPH